MTKPELSVVVPSVNGLADLTGCLTHLERLREEIHLEVLVVDRLGEDLQAEIRRRFPWATVRGVAARATIPEMRAIAFQNANGQAVAVIEDHVLVQPGWGRQIAEALASGTDVIGGPIENAATETLIDRAAFICEYSHCIPPLPAGAADWLPGNNVAYRRELLKLHRSTVEEGHWEGALHSALQQDGIELTCSPDLVALHKKHYSFTEYMGQRYLYSRSFAGTRVTNAPLSKRFAFGLAALGLPPLLLFRIGRQVFRKKRHRLHFLQSVHFIALFVCAWALGEAVGYWFGGGTAMSRVR